MNVKTSFFNKKIFSQNIKKILPFAICILVIELLFSISSLKNMFEQSIYAGYRISNATVYESFSAQATGFFNQILMVICSFCCGVALFNYMFQSKLSKTIHALPITRKTMFISSILSGFVLTILPFIISDLICGIYIAIKGYSFLNIFPSIAIQIGYCFVFFAITILAVMLTGHLVAVPVMYGFLNFGYFAAENLCMAVIYSFFYGLENSWQLGHTIFTPFIYLFSHLGINNETHKLYPKGIHALIAYCIIAIVLLILAYILYKKRLLENQGDPIAAKKLEPIFHYAATLICSGLFTIFLWSIFHIDSYCTYMSPIAIAQVIVIFLISSIIIFYIIKMLFRKTLKVFSTKNPGLFVYLGISVLVFASALLDVYGVENKIPDINDVKSVNINYSYNLEFSLTDSKQIADFMEIHKDFIDAKSDVIANNDYNSNDYSNFYEITYTMKNGQKMTRAYSYCYNLENQDKADKKIAAIDNKINTTIQKNDILFNIIADMDNIQDLTLFEIKHSEENDIEFEDQYTFSPKDFYVVMEALKKDTREGTVIYNNYSQFMNDDIIYEIDVWYGSNYDSYIELYIKSNATNTFKALKECNVLNSEGEIQYNTQEYEYLED